MEKVYYTKEKHIKEECEFEIENIKECFLKGRDENYNRTVYLGIWQKSNTGVEAILEDRRIIFNYSKYGLSGTTVTIKQFLQRNNNVEKISKDIFFNKLNNIKQILDY